MECLLKIALIIKTFPYISQATGSSYYDHPNLYYFSRDEYYFVHDKTFFLTIITVFLKIFISQSILFFSNRAHVL